MILPVKLKSVDCQCPSHPMQNFIDLNWLKYKITSSVTVVESVNSCVNSSVSISQHGFGRRHYYKLGVGAVWDNFL